MPSVIAGLNILRIFQSIAKDEVFQRLLLVALHNPDVIADSVRAIAHFLSHQCIQPSSFGLRYGVLDGIVSYAWRLARLLTHHIFNVTTCRRKLIQSDEPACERRNWAFEEHGHIASCYVIERAGCISISTQYRRRTVDNSPQENSIGLAVARVQNAIVGYIDTHVTKTSAVGHCNLPVFHLRRVQSERSHIANADCHEWNACLVQFVLQFQFLAWHLHITALLSSVWKCQIGRRKELQVSISHVCDQLLLV